MTDALKYIDIFRNGNVEDPDLVIDLKPAIIEYGIFPAFPISTHGILDILAKFLDKLGLGRVENGLVAREIRDCAEHNMPPFRIENSGSGWYN